MSIERRHVSSRMSQIVVHGDTVYLAGQVATGAPGGSMAEQTRDVLNRIDGYLAEVGSNKTKVLRATIWITDMDQFDEMNAVWDAWVAEGETPARATVESKLASPDFCVEVSIIAAR